MARKTATVDVGAAAEFEHARPDRPVVHCPWHGCPYDLTSGRALLDPEHFRVRTYATRVASGRVLS